MNQCAPHVDDLRRMKRFSSCLELVRKAHTREAPMATWDPMKHDGDEVWKASWDALQVDGKAPLYSWELIAPAWCLH